MLKAFSGYVRRQESAPARFLYRVAKSVLGFNVPVIRPLHGALYYLHIGIVVGLRWVKQKFYVEPLFKAVCASCGPGLIIDNAMPLVEGALTLHLGRDVKISGENSFVAAAIFPEPARLSIGDGTMIGGQTAIYVARSVSIGRNCLIARRVMISDTYGHPIAPEKRHGKVGPEEVKDVIIDDNVWIGNGAVVSPGVHIGSGSIVGANAVVTQDVPKNAVVMGSPARVVRLMAQDQA